LLVKDEPAEAMDEDDVGPEMVKKYVPPADEKK